jgi:hypothetical protein
MRNYFLSHVFDRDGDGAGDPPAPPAGGEGGHSGQAAGDPPAGNKDAAPKPPRQRSDAEVFQARTDQLTRQKTELQQKLDAEAARATKAENELRAARELLERQSFDKGPPRQQAADGDGKGDPPAPVRRTPFAPAPTLDEILDSEEGKKAIAKRAAEVASTQQFERHGDELYDTAVEQFGATKVDKALGNFRAFDGLRRDLAEAIFDLDNGPAVLMEIASKPATIEKLYGMTPARMGAAVAAIATTVKVGKQSRAPEPPEPMGGRGNAGPMTIADADKGSMADFVKWREADLKARGVRL